MLLITNPKNALPSSFRDPNGFVYTEKGKLLRQVNLKYKKHYDYLMKSELYSRLIELELMVPHKEVSTQRRGGVYKILEPRKVDFITYPYEWCFGQLKDAALLTLQIQKEALSHGMTLKDASAYNIQFLKGKPVFIDTLSFEVYEDGSTWVPYKQFCQHFLAPLAIASYADSDFIRTARSFLDGIPLGFASKLLPAKSFFKLGLLMHIHLHAKGQKLFQNRRQLTAYNSSKNNVLAVVDSLRGAVSSLNFKKSQTDWSDYYTRTNYSNTSTKLKEVIVEKYLRRVKPKVVWDMGANTGHFSRIASESSSLTVSMDNDTRAVNHNYNQLKKAGKKGILPLVIDITNPSASVGWKGEERLSLFERGPADCIMALALIHHLTITNNVPFRETAEYFRRNTKWLIIEYVDNDDSNAKELIKRKTSSHPYSQNDFESEYMKLFTIEKKNKIRNSKRTLYLLKTK